MNQVGVKAPDALILPDPATRFARTAARLDSLSAGHPMQEWLRFMARLAESQHAVAGAMTPIAGPDPAAVAQAVDARLPPLAADGHRRDPAWRDGLGLLLDGADDRAIPPPARTAMASLRNRGAERVEALADDFLHGCVDAADAGLDPFELCDWLEGTRALSSEVLDRIAAAAEVEIQLSPKGAAK